MKRIILFTCFILLALFLYADDSMQIKVDNVEIEVPLGWFAHYTKQPQIFFLYSPLEDDYDDFQENCNLMKEKLPGKYSMEEYMKASINAVKDVYTGLVIEETGKNYYIFSGIVNDIEVQQIQYYYIKNNYAYILTFSAIPASFEMYFNVFFKKIAESFKIN